MIIVKLMGGLGNQMFEYACGRALSIKHQVPLKLDLSYLNRVWLEKLKGNPVRHYALGIFNLPAELAKKEEIPFLTWFPGTRFTPIINRFNQYFRLPAPFIFRETPGGPKENLKKLESLVSHLYLDGYFQSEKYFSKIAEVIYQDFTFKNQLTPQSQELAKSIKKLNSVSLHIRRGDYVENARISRFHGALTPDYYQRGIAFLAQKISEPHFFIFGDDLTWAHQNLKINHPMTFIEHNFVTPHYYEDMFLMSLCQHNIIANSSFSWWGAYLNQNLQKIVIAPKHWFKARSDDGGVVPKEWVRL